MDSTLAKGLSVLDWLVREKRECRVADVAEAHGLARSNAHRTLQTLVQCGWVVQNAARSGYRPSLRLFELGNLVEGVSDLKVLVHEHLENLARLCGETVHLAVLDSAEIVYLDKFDSPLPVAAYSRIGGRAPAYCVATGKAMLSAAQLEPDALRQLLGSLRAHTPNSIIRISALHAELVRTRARGWAENREEWRLGVCGIGAPVFNAGGDPVAAIGISVPAIRFARSRVRVLAAQVLACADEASKALGYKANKSKSLPVTTNNLRKP